MTGGGTQEDLVEDGLEELCSFGCVGDKVLCGWMLAGYVDNDALCCWGCLWDITDGKDDW